MVCTIPSLSLGTVLTAALSIGAVVRVCCRARGPLLVAIAAAVISSNIAGKSDEEEQ
jgi:hypothetical protein